jgi:hypothetical protein
MAVLSLLLFRNKVNRMIFTTRLNVPPAVRSGFVLKNTSINSNGPIILAYPLIK